ncbi:citrate/2-methylcitrate synthase [Gordonia humi]|uniref:Citrate synthase n=1 Tax=Gordonia humi TaxID=686429 RepID=A0A840EZH3_9ACTN|nr:citrate/2-methylcitrate synthase [Gordonia humi]MBB4135643.1 citrate synthase [Gordonia humi]
MSTPISVPRGLKNVIVTDTEIGDVRGEEGFYHYRQYDATQLARTATFEDVWHLMVFGTLPSPEQSAAFVRRIGALRVIDDETVELLRRVAGPGVEPLAALRVALAALGVADRPTFDMDRPELVDAALRTGAVVPTILAAAHRISQGLDVLDPDPEADHVSDYLRMATGSSDAEAADSLRTYLITTIDHGFNASTFAGRVVASTGSDMTSSVLGALGAFLGPRHGGAPSRALAALDEIGDPANTRDWVRGRIERGEIVMGFGHAVYRTRDPRAELLKSVVRQRYDSDLVRQAMAVEAEIEAAINELKPGRRLYANVEFYAGVLMHEVGLPVDMFTPTFGVARVVGWTANILEQVAEAKIIRPVARYVGPEPVRAE